MQRTRVITEPLQTKIDLIGRLVRQVVGQQTGAETARLIEDLMDLCEAASRSNQWRSHTDLQPRIEALELDQLVWICRAFTVFFHLVNEAERQEIIRINRLAAQKETLECPHKGSILEAIHRFAQPLHRCTQPDPSRTSQTLGRRRRRTVHTPAPSPVSQHQRHRSGHAEYRVMHDPFLQASDG